MDQMRAPAEMELHEYQSEVRDRGRGQRGGRAQDIPRRVDGLGEERARDRADDVCDEEAREGNRVGRVAAPQDLLLEALQAGVAEVTAVEVGGQVEEDGERDDDAVELADESPLGLGVDEVVVAAQERHNVSWVQRKGEDSRGRTYPASVAAYDVRVAVVPSDFSSANVALRASRCSTSCFSVSIVGKSCCWRTRVRE